jgi:hypothetical protein
MNSKLTRRANEKPGENNSRPTSFLRIAKSKPYCNFCIVIVTVASDPAVRLYETQ